MIQPAGSTSLPTGVAPVRAPGIRPMPDDPVHAVLGRVARWKIAILAVAFVTVGFALTQAEAGQSERWTHRRHIGILGGVLLIAGMNVGALWKARHPDPPKTPTEAWRAWFSHVGGDLVGLAIWGASHMAPGRLGNLTIAGMVNLSAWVAVLVAGFVVSPVLVSRAVRDHSGMRT